MFGVGSQLTGATRQRLADVGLAVLRVASGGTMAVAHGWGKLTKLLGGGEIRFADPLGIGATPSLVLAVGAELFCGVLLVIGLATRLAALPLAFTMAVAAFVVHGGDPFGKRELALLYLSCYVAVAALGAGRYSADGWLASRRR